MSLTQDKLRKDAVAKLEELIKFRPKLRKPVFFVPGWTDEANVCWTSA